jgi:SAM-dependent methyltransferase
MAAEMLRVTAGKSPDPPCANGDAMRLPFTDGAFDHVIAVGSLCFVTDQSRALREMVRVERGHSPAEARAMLAGAGLRGIRVASAIFDPAGGCVAQALEARLPSLPFGGFLAVTGTPHSGGAQNRPGNRSQ